MASRRRQDYEQQDLSFFGGSKMTESGARSSCSMGIRDARSLNTFSTFSPVLADVFKCVCRFGVQHRESARARNERK